MNGNCDEKDKTPSQKAITLGSLYFKDLDNGLILPEYPSTFNPIAKLQNKVKYIYHDYTSSSQVVQDPKQINLCPIAGNEVPMMLREKPKRLLQEHWRKWLPFFPEAKLIDFDLDSIGQRQCFTRYERRVRE